MNEFQSGPRPAQRFTRLVPLGLVAALGVYGLCHWASYSKALGSYQEGPEYYLAQLKALYPEPSPQENAAPLYLESFQSAFFTLQPVPWVNPDVVAPEPAQPIPDAMKTAMTEYLKSHAVVLDKLQQAAACAQCRYPIRLEDGFAVELYHLGKLHDASRLLCVEAALAAEDGDAARAVRALMANFALAQSLANEPIVISQVVRFACTAAALDGLERVLNRTVLTDAQLQALAQIISRMEIPGALTRAVQGESYMLMTYMAYQGLGGSEFEFSREARNAGMLSSLAGRYAQLTPVGLFDRAIVTLAGNLAVDASRKPYPQCLKDPDAWDRYGHLMALISGPTAAMMYGSHRFLESGARSAARVRTALCALAIERFRLARHALPESLDQLVPTYLTEVPKDTYNGAPLQYERFQPQGYAVRSEGFRKQPSASKTNNPRDQHPMFWIEH